MGEDAVKVEETPKSHHAGAPAPMTQAQFLSWRRQQVRFAFFLIFLIDKIPSFYHLSNCYSLL